MFIIFTMEDKKIFIKKIEEKAEQIEKLKKNISKVFVGKEFQIKILILGVISGLHVLIEDIPGIGKTTLAKCLAASVGLDFGRIQFTPDLLPGDILGMTIWNNEKREFSFKQGSIIHQFILADEINRASPRTQSAFLEAMQEGSVTVEGKTYKLPQPFFVVATQNPITFIGTFLLPEAQVDRFGLSFSIGYPPSEKEEIAIMTRFKETDPLLELEPVISPDDILEIRRLTRQIYVEDNVYQYIAQLIRESRNNRNVKLGLSPRASQHLLLACQANAMSMGREYLIPEDVMNIGNVALAHRLVLSSEAKMENKQPQNVLSAIRNKIEVPTGVNEK
jgi:MoxR-like ATPase